MDINGQHYFLLREEEEFEQRSTRLMWHGHKKALCIAQNQLMRLPENNVTAALSAWQTQAPLAYDGFSQHAKIFDDEIHYNSGRGYLPILDDRYQKLVAAAGNFEDVCLGGDDLMAAPYSDQASEHGVTIFHLRRRWQASLRLPERILRVCIDHHDTVWCLGSTQVFACEGAPLTHEYYPQPSRFEPQTLNPEPFSLQAHIAIPPSDQVLAIDSDEETLYVLSHDGGGVQYILTMPLQLNAVDWQRFRIDEQCPFAIDLKVLAARRLALLVPAQADDTEFRQRDAAIVQLSHSAEEPGENHTAVLVRERYPMLSQAKARFVSSADGKLRYQAVLEADSEALAAGFDARPRELLPLRRPRFFTQAEATLLKIFDSGNSETIWHRVYMEGCIPPTCRLRLFAKTFDNPDQRGEAPWIEQAEWLWCSHRSDQGFGVGLVEAKEGESGLFELLLQRQAGPVRRLTGRYLQLRITMEGDGRNSPAIHALKVYYPRFSYQESYLPEHFRQEFAVDPSLDHLRANGADVRERMLAAFEGVLSPIENTIESAETLLSPRHTPAEHLPWLAELFGQSLPPEWPLARQRRWLENSGELQRCRGTLAGVQLALDIATDGAVQRGEVVIVENYRLRRTMATILGLYMDDSEHPLTLGTGQSGNSIVGDSLILSDGDAREFLALFAPEIADAREEKIVEEFFDRYANKVTLLLHGSARALRDSVEKMLMQQMPAHLQWQVHETDHPFVLGLSPLLSVDTFLEKRPAPKRLRLNNSYLGAEGLLSNLAAFNPQDVNRHSQ